MLREYAAISLLLSTVCASGAVSHAGEPNPLADAIAPFVDNQTVAIVHVDLAAFDAAEAVDLLAEFLNLPPRTRDSVQANLVPLNVVADALPPGAKADLFIVSSVSDMATLPLFFVVPLSTDAANPISLELRRAASAQLRTELNTERIGQALVTANPKTITRLKKAPAAPRPEIAAAFTAAGASQFKFLLVPSQDARRAIELLVPKLPVQLGGRPTRTLTAHLVWVSAGIDLPPKPTRFRAVVQATKTESAQALAGELKTILAALAGLADLPPAAGQRERLDRLVAPRVADDRITFDLTSAQIAAFRPILLPILKSAENAIVGRAGAAQPVGK
jgi:hypothetical protein